MKLYDAIIVGGGPAGLMAARELENGNINYLVLESKQKAGYPLKCGEITREETFTELFERTDYPFIKNNITNKGTFHAKMVILASGTNFRHQKKLNLVKKNVELVPCIGGLFKNSTLPRDTAYFLYDENSLVATWIFPKGENIVNAGAGAMLKNYATKRLNLKTEFENSLDKYGVPLEGVPSFSGNYVTSGPIHRTYSDRLLVCGDAAGQVYAGIGEGVYFALKAGQIAGKTAVKAIKKETFNSIYLKEYETIWKQVFGRQMDAGVIFTTSLFFMMKKQLIRNALKKIKPEEIVDIWFNGKISLRFRLIYYLLKLIGRGPVR